MHSNKQRRAEIKATRLRRKSQKAQRLRANLGITDRPWLYDNAAYELVDRLQLAADNSYGVPDFVARGYYLDKPFTCVDCGDHCVWTAAQQKWWYETAKGNVWTTAKRCRKCRANERRRRDEARRVHLEGLRRHNRGLPPAKKTRAIE